MHGSPKQKQKRTVKAKRQKPTKFKMKKAFTAAIFLLTMLPYSSTLSLPTGDPAPGRSPGPPESPETPDPDEINLEMTTHVELTSTESYVDVADACEIARMPSDSADVVTVEERDSDVNLTVSHAVFETDELVRGVSYDVHLTTSDASLRDYVLHSIVGSFIRGNFTPTAIPERPCHDDSPHFIPKHNTKHKHSKSELHSPKNELRTSKSEGHSKSEVRNLKSEGHNSKSAVLNLKTEGHSSKSEGHNTKSETHSSKSDHEHSKLKSVHDLDSDLNFELKSDSNLNYETSDYVDFSFKIKSDDQSDSLKESDYEDDFRTGGEYYFRPRVKYREARAVRRSVRRRRFQPSRVVSGPLGGRRSVLLQWTVSESLHLDSEEITVIFRLRYRKTTSATIYQVFFTKILRLDCAIRLRAVRSGRVHSGHLPRTRGCRLLLTPPSPNNALLIDLHKLNVPCSSGFIRFAPNTPTLCGKLEQIPTPNRKFLYQATAKSPAIELHGRPTFAATYRLVDHCHSVLLTGQNGSFEVGPTSKLFCSYTIHLPYGNKVALRLQMGTGPMNSNNEDVSNSIQDEPMTCNGMEIRLQDGDLKWNHCSQPGDPLRSVQIVSDTNCVKLNISVVSKNSTAQWLKVWWMDTAVPELIGHCDYGWVQSGDFCVSAFRETKRAWRQAEAECVRLGGHLASVLNERQQRVLDDLLLNTPSAGVDDVYWIGATDAVHEGEFRWSDGLPFSYTHWFPGWRKHSSQPNDDGTSGQDCVEARRELPPRPPPDTPTYMWNDRGCREHNYFICERPIVNDPYTASKIQCNETIVLSHSHPHATVSSPGFPRAYPDDALCVTDVMAPKSHTLTLHIEELFTEYEPHCSYDYLEIQELGSENDSEAMHPHDLYNGFNEVWEEPVVQLSESDAVSAGWQTDGRRRLCGDWGGKLKLLRYRSRSSALRLRFRSDHARRAPGYRARVTMADSQTCMDVKQVLNNGHCYLFVGYPKTSWITAKQVCEGLNMQLSSVHSAEEERFIITGIRQSSEYSAGVITWLGARDQVFQVSPSQESGLQWVDGTPQDYYGWPLFNDTDGGDACLGVQWKSSPAAITSGLYWSLQKCQIPGGYVCKRRLSPERGVKNYTVEGSSGELFSPNHPAQYDSDLDYWVHIRVASEARLVVVFTAIDLEYQRDCLYDYVELMDPASHKSQRYCGALGETRWVSSGSEADLHFHSDYNTQGSGFTLQWRAVALTGCPSQTITSKEGVIQSPNYPHFLLPGLDCTVDILAPTGKKVFLNITHFDFGYGIFNHGVPINVTGAIPPDTYLSIQVESKRDPVKTYQHTDMLTNGLFVSETELLTVRLKTGVNVTGRGFLAHFKSVNNLNTTHIVNLSHVHSGRLSAPNWPSAAPARSQLRTRLLASHSHTLTVAFARTRLVVPKETEPCGEGNGWIEVKDSFTDHNGTQWTLCEIPRIPLPLDQRGPQELPPGGPQTMTLYSETAPLVIRSYLHSLTVTLVARDNGVNFDVSLIVNKDPEYHNKLLVMPEETSVEACYPNPCENGGRCGTDHNRSFCTCGGYYTGVFCLLTACERSPCVFGNCSLTPSSPTDDSPSEPFTCVCDRGWRGRRCSEKIRPCNARPCNNRGACIERDGGFLCQCNPSWKGKRCETPHPNPKILGLGARMLQEPFWLGLIAVFVVMGTIGLIWCARRHFPEKIEKLLAEEADRCARRSPSPRKKRNNSTPTRKNAAEKKQILQQLISPASANDHSKKMTMGELIQMSEKRNLMTVESAPAFMEYGFDNREPSFPSVESSPSTSPSMRHIGISDPKLEKKVTFARLLNKVSAEMSSSSDMDMVNTIAIPMAVISDRGMRKASSTPPSPNVEVRSPHSTSSNQGSDSMSSLDLTLAHAAFKKYSRTPKISSADSILAMFRNFSSSSAAIVSRASSGGISASSTPSASSPQDDTNDADDLSFSSLVPSLAPDSPIARQYNTIEIQVLDPLSAHKSSSPGSNLLHPPSILLEVPSTINKCLSPIRELPTPLPTPQPTPLPTPLPSPRMPRAMDAKDMEIISQSEDEFEEINRNDRPSGLKLKLRQPAISLDTSPSTVVTDTPSPSFTQSQDSERESSPSPNPPALCVPILTIERPSPGSPPPRRTPPHTEFQPPPLITVTYNASEESDEPLSPRPPPQSNMCFLSPFSMSSRGERAPSESNLSSSGYSSMASPGPSRCGSSNPLCPSEMEDPGSGGGPSCFSRRRPLMKTNSSPAASNEDTNERTRGRSDSETLSDDPLIESNDEGIGTDEKIDDVPTSAKEMETLVVLKEADSPATLCSPSGVTKCSIIKCVSVERGLDEKACLRLPEEKKACLRLPEEKACLRLPTLTDTSRPLSPVSSRSESPLSDKTALGRFSPQFYGRQLPFTDSDGLYDFPSSDCVKGGSIKGGVTSQKKSGRKRDRRTSRTVSQEVAGTAKPVLPHMPHSMVNLLEVPGYLNLRGRKSGRRRSRSQAPAPPSSSSSEDSVSNASVASVASVASAKELRVATDLEMQLSDSSRPRKPLRRQKCRSSEIIDASSKISSSVDLTADSKKPNKINKLRTISNQIRFLRRLERSLKMKEHHHHQYPPLTDDEGDESSSVTSPLLQGRKDISHATSAPMLNVVRPKIVRQRRYDRGLVSEDNNKLNVAAGQDNSD